MQIWWLTSRGTRQWSVEERRARLLIYVVAIPIFLFIFFAGMWIFRLMLHLGEAAAMLISIAIAGYISLFLSRGLCGWVWPELFQTADANAATRLGIRRI
jgi:hypothetical protein